MNELSNSDKKHNLTLVISAIIFSAWLIGMGIVIAGWLISKQISKNTVTALPQSSGAINQNEPVNIDIPSDIPQLGDPNAKVTMVEFADFQCPYCGQWQQTVFQEIKSKYIDTGKVRFVFMDFAFLGAESIRAAEASRCAADQNKFWEYHDYLFTKQSGENQNAYADSNLKQFAQDVKLNTSEFNTCFDSNTHSQKLQSDYDKAIEYGVQSTPTVFINGIKYEGVLPFTQYEAIIETELAK